MTHQLTLDGNSKFIGSDHDKALYILTNYPEARNSYKAAMFAWWREFDGANAISNPMYIFAWIRNRIQEIQNQYPHLDASEEVEEWREKRSKQGVLE